MQLTGTGPTRTETDSLGSVEVPADRYWGAQTARSVHFFDYPGEAMPVEIVHALARIKQAAARVNVELGVLDAEKGLLIDAAAEEVAQGTLDAHFPLSVFQTGSGTQTNMNVNEVIANRAIERSGGVLGSKDPIHPNDDVNRSQSSNDIFPSGVHVAVALAAAQELVPVLGDLAAVFTDRAERWAGVVKLGRTHLQDAVPLTVGQEWSGYAALVRAGADAVVASLPAVEALAVGGTAVGTGLNAPPGFGPRVCEQLAVTTGRTFRPDDNLFGALSGADGLVTMSAALRHVAVNLTKVANDLRWLGAGPRGGIAELRLPANEPGSSIMPGKVNPTQAEALLMVCAQVFGNDVTVAFGASQGNFELNVMRPVMGANVLRSIHLLSRGSDQFRRHLVEGIELDEPRITELVNRSLMLVTALVPHVGYDKAAQIAHHAHHHGISLREAAGQTGHLTVEQFDAVIDVASMTGPR